MYIENGEIKIKDKIIEIIDKKNNLNIIFNNVKLFDIEPLIRLDESYWKTGNQRVYFEIIIRGEGNISPK